MQELRYLAAEYAKIHGNIELWDLMMQPADTILITGGSGLVGSNLREYLHSQGFERILAPSSAECDLTGRHTVLDYFEQIKPNYVFHMAGFVRGILYNMRNHGEAYLKNTSLIPIL